MRKILAGIGFFLGIFSLSISPLKAAEEQYVLWGDARSGSRLFAEKGCGSCHGIRGVGPGLGPDLGKIAQRLTMTQLAGAMWNHAPVMRKLAKEKGIVWKPFSGSEMRDLISYLYSISLLDQPGDPKRGERLFVERGCATCHRIRGKGGTVGPDLAKWKRYGSPILWAELMWSHALGMEEKMREFGLRWPNFGGNEMVDVIAYIQQELGSSAPAR
jgi:mono/diheme cytochrome c family protein